MKPIITIVIPSYNKELYIKRCIDSVIKQHISKKIVVIDNQSTDKTWDIVNSYGDDVIKIQNETNIGMAGNWNKCIDVCDTELLMILHADDELKDDVLKLYVDFYKKHNHVGLIHASSLFINEDSKREFVAISDVKKIRTKGKDALNKVIGDANIICSSVVAPKKIYEKEGYFIKDSLSSDIEMRARIAKDYDIGYISESTVNVYVNDDSTGKGSLLNRSVKETLKDRDNLNNIMLSYYKPEDKKQAMKYSNKAIIAGLFMIIHISLLFRQYSKIIWATYYMIFKYNIIFNSIVWNKATSMIGRKIKSLFHK